MFISSKYDQSFIQDLVFNNGQMTKFEIQQKKNSSSKVEFHEPIQILLSLKFHSCETLTQSREFVRFKEELI